MHGQAVHKELRDSDKFLVIWDSGASICITNDKYDFIGTMTPPQKYLTVKGISTALKLEGSGKVCWTFLDVEDELQDIVVDAYYAPDIQTKLLSTRVCSVNIIPIVNLKQERMFGQYILTQKIHQ